MAHSEISLFCIHQHKKLKHRFRGEKKNAGSQLHCLGSLIPYGTLFAALPNINILKPIMNG